MSRRGVILFIAVGIIWGVPYFLIRIAVRDLSPTVLVLARTLPATVILLPIALRRGGWREAFDRWRPIVAYSAIEFIIPWLMLFRAEQRLPSALSGLLIASVPIIALLLAKATGSSEHFGRRRVLGLVVGLVGVGALVGVDVRGDELLSVGEIALTAVGYAAGPMIVSRYLAGLPGIIVVTLSLALGSVVYAPFALASLPRHIGPETWWAVAGLAVLCTAIGFLAFFALIAEVGPTRATVVTYLNPAVAVLLGIGVLHEPFTLGIAFGFPLIIAGSYFSTHAPVTVAARPGPPA